MKVVKDTPEEAKNPLDLKIDYFTSLIEAKENLVIALNIALKDQGYTLESYRNRLEIIELEDQIQHHKRALDHWTKQKDIQEQYKKALHEEVSKQEVWEKIFKQVDFIKTKFYNKVLNAEFEKVRQVYLEGRDTNDLDKLANAYTFYTNMILKHSK